MNLAIAGLALLLLVACFDTAKRMSLNTWRRNPLIALSVIVVGAGCAVAIFCAYQPAFYQVALLTIVAGRLIHFIADRRTPFYVDSRDPAGDCTCTPAMVDRPRQQPAVYDIQTGNPVGRRARVSAVR